jgi:hypothetical protein
MSTNQAEGVMYPTQKAMIASNPRDSSIASLQNSNISHQKAVAAMAGGKKKKYRGCKGGSIVAPQMNVLYQEQSGNGTGVNAQMAGNTELSTQQHANRVNDGAAFSVKGGSKKRKGGNPNWLWGCMSGGKKKSRKQTKRTRKSKKTTKRRH